IALHHLTLNFLAPALIFPEGADFARVLLHAVIVVIETAALVWMCLHVNQLIVAVNGNLAVAEKATGETRVAADRMRLLAQAETTRRQTMADVAANMDTE